MYPKNKSQKVIELYSDKLISDLGIDDWNIEIHLLSSKSSNLNEKLKKIGFNCNWAKTKFAVSMLDSNKHATIIVFYDKVKNRKDLLATLYHEYVHLVLYKLTKKFTIRQVNKHRLEDIEEDIVHVLERTYLRRLK